LPNFQCHITAKGFNSLKYYPKKHVLGKKLQGKKEQKKGQQFLPMLSIRPKIDPPTLDG